MPERKKNMFLPFGVVKTLMSKFFAGDENMRRRLENYTVQFLHELFNLWIDAAGEKAADDESGGG